MPKSLAASSKITAQQVKIEQFDEQEVFASNQNPAVDKTPKQEAPDSDTVVNTHR
jgi:hypothetical protein